MASRRYYIALAPVEHINGKMAPVRVKCKNVQTEEQSEQDGFYYGYKKQATQGLSRYAIRTRGRVLSIHPYTSWERFYHQNFADSVTTIKNVKTRRPNSWRMMLAEFNTQKKYLYPWNFALAETIKNYSEWPSRWSPV